MSNIYWRCFHCGDAFTKEQEQHARDHFGANQLETPVCLMRVPGERSLLSALRRAQDELTRYRNDDTPLLRAMYSMETDYAERFRNAEEAGYARALRDVEAGKIEAEHKSRILVSWGVGQ